MALLEDMATMRLLPDATTSMKPRMIIVHTMAGFLAGSDAHFRNSTNAEAHFGIGGPGDKGGLDGVIWQWVDTERRADANAAANGFAISIETSDGTKPATPWSEKQLTSLIRLIDRLCELHAIPKRLVTSVADPLGGLAWHSMFPQWSKDRHDCPGSVRVQQLKTTVFPAVGLHHPDVRPDPKEEVMPFTLSRPQGGYIVVDPDGGVFPGPPGGPAPDKGSLRKIAVQPSAPIVAGAWTPSGDGYWLLGADGALFAFGDAPGILGSNVDPLKEHVGARRICGLIATGPASVRIIAEEKPGDFDTYDVAAP